MIWIKNFASFVQRGMIKMSYEKGYGRDYSWLPIDYLDFDTRVKKKKVRIIIDTPPQ